MAGEAYADAFDRARRSLEEAESAAYRDLYAAAPMGAAARASVRMRLAAHRRAASAKLVRAVPRLPRFVTDFDVGVAQPEHAEDVGFLVAASFDLTVAAEPLFAALVTREGWTCHVALRDGELVAAGLLYTAGRVGWLGFAATRPDSRGHGAHSALVGSRLSAATTSGCYSLVAEAPAGSAAAPSTARRNLERAGFEVAYLRA